MRVKDLDAGEEDAGVWADCSGEAVFCGAAPRTDTFESGPEEKRRMSLFEVIQIPLSVYG